MGIEIERRYLLDERNADGWREFPSQAMLQGYVALDGTGANVRVRVADNKAVLTIKGARSGFSRPEYEFDIPIREAEAMLSELHVGSLIEKRRYRVPFEGYIWEVDEFYGNNSGLIIAEIELPSEETVFDSPPWLGREITHFARYGNASLSVRPYGQWPVEDQLSPGE